jgi:hypothetical protein
MNRYFLFLTFLFISTFTKSQSWPTALKNDLLQYFISLPGNNDFHNWIEKLKNEPSIIIDTTISKETNDSSYFYLRLDSKNFVSLIEAKRKMVIMATNHRQMLPASRNLLLIQMEYYGDTSTNGELAFRNLYNDLCKKFKPYFTDTRERSSSKKKKNYAINSFYSDGQSFPTLIIRRGKYYQDRSNGLVISLYYELKKKTESSFYKD